MLGPIGEDHITSGRPDEMAPTLAFSRGQRLRKSLGFNDYLAKEKHF
jgi:hypothetical protein